MKRSNLKDRTKSGQKDQSLRALFSLYRYNWKRLTPIFLTRILSNLFVALLPYFIGRIAGLITSPNVEFGELVKLVSIMVMSNLVHDILWRASGLMSIYRMTPVLYQLRTISQQFAWKYQYKDFTEKPSGKIASSLQDIYGRGSQIIVEFEEDDIEQMVKFPIFIGILLLATKENAILFAFFTVLLICVSWLSLKRVRRTASVHADMQSTVLGRLYDSFSNFVNVKSFKSEELEVRSLEKDSQAQLKTSTNRNMADEIYWASAAVVIRWGLWISFAVLNLWLYKNGRLDAVGFITA